MSPSSNYVYSALDLGRSSIRLVRLLHGLGIVQCELVESYIEDSIPYEALSYAWESEKGFDEILLDGHVFRVTKNLERALCSLRDEDSDRILWIDALCIDQNNSQERNHQVQKMGSIYKSADRVVVWLGPAFPHGKAILEFLASDYDSSSALAANRRSRQYQDELHQLLLSFKALLSQSWFSRVWVIQEVAHARATTILCGSRVLQAANFERLRTALAESEETVVAAKSDHVLLERENILNLLIKPTKYKRAWRNKQPLIRLVEQFRGAQATDLRDKVYALLALSSDAHDAKFPVDYKKSVVEVWRDVVVFSIQNSFTLDALAISGMHDESQYPKPAELMALPSWIPDWSTAAARDLWQTSSIQCLKDDLIPQAVGLRLTGIQGTCLGLVESIGLNSPPAFNLVTPFAYAKRTTFSPQAYQVWLNDMEKLFRKDFGLILEMTCDPSCDHFANKSNGTCHHIVQWRSPLSDDNDSAQQEIPNLGDSGWRWDHVSRESGLYRALWIGCHEKDNCATDKDLICGLILELLAHYLAPRMAVSKETYERLKKGYLQISRGLMSSHINDFDGGYLPWMHDYNSLLWFERKEQQKDEHPLARGDLLCWLRGAPAPAILRKSHNGYRFIRYLCLPSAVSSTFSDFPTANLGGRFVGYNEDAKKKPKLRESTQLTSFEQQFLEESNAEDSVNQAMYLDSCQIDVLGALDNFQLYQFDLI